jgi:hypothetical protein
MIAPLGLPCDLQSATHYARRRKLAKPEPRGKLSRQAAEETTEVTAVGMRFTGVSASVPSVSSAASMVPSSNHWKPESPLFPMLDGEPSAERAFRQNH